MGAFPHCVLAPVQGWILIAAPPHYVLLLAPLKEYIVVGAFLHCVLLLALTKGWILIGSLISSLSLEFYWEESDWTMKKSLGQAKLKRIFKHLE